MDIEERVERLEAKHQVMAAFLHAVAATCADRQAVAQAFRERAEALELLYRSRPEETGEAFLDAWSLARLAIERALDEAQATH